MRSILQRWRAPSGADARRVALTVVSGLGVWLIGFEINVLWGPGEHDSAVFGHDAFVLVLGMGGLLCLARGAVYAKERAAWMALGAGCTVWAAAEAYYGFVLAPMKVIPDPSLADAGYLGFYPLAFVGTIMLLRARSGRASAAQWLDGLTAAMAAGALSAAVGLDATLKSIGGKPLEVATNLAYPIGDLMLLAIIVGALVVCGLRGGRAWLWLALGIGLFCVADGLYLVKSAEGSYHLGGWFDVGWPAGMVFLAAGAWSDAPTRAAPIVHAARGIRPIVLPIVFAVISIGLLLYTGSAHLNWVARILAAGSLGVVLLRLTQTFKENTQIMAERNREAHSDALTGLPNRRALNSALARVDDGIGLNQPVVVAVFDLDGFKHYNDTFGHHAGDALLARLGAKLSESVAGRGQAYRMGGDEFCAIIEGAEGDLDDAVQRAAAALTDVGEGFAISSSYGVAHMPLEASDAESALRLADQRMYDHKGTGRASAKNQSRDVLLQALREHTPSLGDHTRGVRELAEAVARRLGHTEDAIEMTGITADLHDVGKMAIPSAILDKPGALDEKEWAFMRRHTIIGERIVAAAPALADVAAAVRATHERWDGDGYPDGIAANSIPTAARVVAVCDAFDAMIAERPYSASRATSAAVIELKRCARAQFDPAVVDAFEQVLADRFADPTAPAETDRGLVRARAARLPCPMS
jgi:two-component system, cell cycle response regulator